MKLTWNSNNKNKKYVIAKHFTFAKCKVKC